MRIFLAFILTCLSACATIDPGGAKVKIVSNVDRKCKNLGPVTVIVTGWGLAEESQNVLRNNVAEKGGNTLVQNGNDSGIAYDCPSDASSN